METANIVGHKAPISNLILTGFHLIAFAGISQVILAHPEEGAQLVDGVEWLHLSVFDVRNLGHDLVPLYQIWGDMR